MKKNTQYCILLMLFILSTSVYAQNAWPPPDAFGVSTWTGNSNTSFNNGDNWDPIGLPNPQRTLIIPAGTDNPLIADIPFHLTANIVLGPGIQLSLDRLVVAAGGYIWLQSEPENNLFSKLTTNEPDVWSDSEFDGSVKIEAGSSLIANRVKVYKGTNITLESTSTTYASVILDNINFTQGAAENVKIIYKRHTNKIGSGTKGGNDLISSPLRGNFNAAFVIANQKLPQNPTNTGEYAFAPYNVTAGAYQNFNINANNTGSFPLVPGKGFRAATSDGSPLTFTGYPNLLDVTIPIINGATDKGNGWNLIGNPFLSYLKFKEFFELNKTELLDGYQTIYGYNSAATTWTTWNQATIDDPAITELITPGQGFFVRSKPGGGTISFLKSMKTTGTSDDFIVGRPKNKNIGLSKLSLSNGSDKALTSVYFIEGTTRGMDEGYDAASYSGEGHSVFSIFTNLVENNTDLDLAIQSLPYNDFNDVIVPLGIKAKAGKELSISLDDLSTIPSNISVYLEDTQTKTLNLLNDGAYTFKSTIALNGADRFNIHYSSKTLSSEDIQLNDNLRIYTTASPKTLFIKGHLTKAATANLYDIQGRLVRSKVLNPNTTENTMDISNISTGVYVVKLDTDNQVKTQKVIIK